MGQDQRETTLDSDEAVAASIIRLVAAVKDVDPVAIDDRLYHHIDPDALERLCQTHPTGTPSPTIEVSFAMAGCQITIHAGEKVTVSSRSTSKSMQQEAI